MRNYNTESEINNIPNVSWKRNTICQMYNEHCDYTVKDQSENIII